MFLFFTTPCLPDDYSLKINYFSFSLLKMKLARFLKYYFKMDEIK